MGDDSPAGARHQTAVAEGRNKPLTAECKARFRELDLHWHDLRHEAASRLVEEGIALSLVRDLLGHSSIVTTERYDNQTFAALQNAAKKLERGESFKIPSRSDLDGAP